MVKNTEVISRQPNNFGALRLFFAFLVIFSHSPEIIDGNNSREFLNQITNGTMVSGTVGVCGFFLVSGYLIFNSYQHSISLFNYLNKRLLRIFPGFIVAYIVSILVFSSISGGWNLVESYLHNWPKNFVKMLLLYQPIVDGVFKENHIHTLNVSMWTIQIEFLCYLMTPLFAILYLRNKSYYLTLMVLVSFFYLFLLISGINFNTGFPFFIQIPLTVRPITAFIIGGAFYIFKDKLLWNNISAIISFFMLIVCLFIPLLADLGLLYFGGYLVFYFALHFKHSFLNRIGTKNDVSYGVYLFAWPLQSLMVEFNPQISPWLLSITTIIFASMTGWISWKLVEKPFIKLKKFYSKN